MFEYKCATMLSTNFVTRYSRILYQNNRACNLSRRSKLGIDLQKFTIPLLPPSFIGPLSCFIPWSIILLPVRLFLFFSLSSTLPFLFLFEQRPILKTCWFYVFIGSLNALEYENQFISTSNYELCFLWLSLFLLFFLQISKCRTEYS